MCQEQVSLGEGYLETPFVVKGGYVELPLKPGLGIELDAAAMADKIGHDWTNPQTTTRRTARSSTGSGYLRACRDLVRQTVGDGHQVARDVAGADVVELHNTITVTLSSGTRWIIVAKPLMPPPCPICSCPDCDLSGGLNGPAVRVVVLEWREHRRARGFGQHAVRVERLVPFQQVLDRGVERTGRIRLLHVERTSR